MAAIGGYFTQSELAMAAYADISSGMIGNDVINELKRVGMSAKQAALFVDTYTVIDRKFDSTGLSVTLFEKIQPNAHGSKDQHVAIRGTQDIMDFLTDIIFIGLVGSIARQNQYAALSAYVQGWMGSNNNKLRPGFTVSGHSLGGFLATTLALDFPGQISHTYLYNSRESPVFQSMGSDSIDLV